MRSQLMKLYNDQLVLDPTHTDDPNEFLWFYTDRKELVGFPKTVSTEERGLLHTFLQRVTLSELSQSEAELRWYQLLLEDANNLPEHMKNSDYVFIFYYLNTSTDHSGALTEALRHYGSVVWTNDQEGVLIVERSTPSHAEQIALVQSTFQALAEDLSVDVHDYVTRAYTDISKAKAMFHAERERFHLFISWFQHRRSFNATDAPLIDLVKTHSHEALTHWQKSLLQNTDHELRRTIFTYLHSQMNLTKAARQLHIHRNTLQYRLDKFQEQAGPVFQHFSLTTAVYLALWLTGEAVPFVHIDEVSV
ncbi:helix-turn-helix domain-containing protein [Geomicrobium sp. JSM 1781026]|uniref:helix-turn-helix domain-containing protein n=1 Tax=Geomicrobium sp. JSM 1781026 TaxID=3344580 RepID=UPI0035BF37BC